MPSELHKYPVTHPASTSCRTPFIESAPAICFGRLPEALWLRWRSLPDSNIGSGIHTHPETHPRLEPGVVGLDRRYPAGGGSGNS